MTHSFRLFKELLLRLSKKELSFLKRKLEVNVESSDKNKNKSKELLKLVLKNMEITQIEVERGLYGTSNKIAFNKLIDRAIEKIEEILIGFTKEASLIYSERNYYYFLLKRKLLVLQMRWLRGIGFDLEQQFDKIIALSEKYELVEILIDALYSKQRYVGFRVGKVAFNSIGSKIEKAEFRRKAMVNARNIHFRFATNHIAFPIYNKDELKKSIDKLKQDYILTGSQTIKLYLYYLQVEWLFIHSKFQVAERVLNKLLKHVIENPAVYTIARHGDVFLNLATNEIYLKEFSLAINNCLIAQTFYQKNSESKVFAKELEFYARFYNKELENSEKVIEEIYNFSKSGNIHLFHSRRAYLFACVKTIRGEIKKSNELLLEIKEIEKDKGGWNLGKWILAIINGIESGDYEGVESKVLSLEKFLKRISKANYVRKRDKVILRILLKLINEGYDFNKVYQSRKKYFDLLEGSDPEYGWKIKSPELIVFHDWFKKKMHQGITTKLTTGH